MICERRRDILFSGGLDLYLHRRGVQHRAAPSAAADHRMNACDGDRSTAPPDPYAPRFRDSAVRRTLMNVTISAAC